MSRALKPSIFGVKIDNITQKEVFTRISAFLTSEKYHHIVTLNPEILLKSRKNQKYKEILNASTLNIVDGIGIKFALWRQGRHLKKRFTGVDLMHEVLQGVNDKSGDVFLAVNENGLSDWKEVRDTFNVFYSRISFAGANINPKNVNDILEGISVDLVLCNFGAPEQEMFLHRLKASHAKIGIGVGGSFDYATGAISRAPRSMRVIGLEWLYRLYKQPCRWKRICNAVIIFPILILFNKE